MAEQRPAAEPVPLDAFLAIRERVAVPGEAATTAPATTRATPRAVTGAPSSTRPQATPRATARPAPSPTSTAPARPRPTTPAAPKPAATPAVPKPAATAATGSSALRQRIVAAARSYVGRGIPYVWGGKTVAGLDCSGLTWLVLRDAGLAVPYRNSSALKAWATPISKADAQPGDLLFVPGHVAIVVAPGRVVDAANPERDISEHQLWSTWSTATYGRVPTKGS